MNVYSQIAEKIIEQQEAIIGPVAIEQAEQVKGIQIDWSKHDVSVSGDGSVTIDKLVEQYKELFGKISVEVCKEATSRLVSELPADQQPKSLK